MKHIIVFSTVVVSLLQALSAQDSPTAHHYFLKSSHPPVAAWSYSGATGPMFWGSLDPSYRVAASGKHQSPIDVSLAGVPAKPLPELKFDYRRERISAMNNGHTIEHEEAPGSFLYVGEERFSLEQFHLHAPSEHTVDGRHFDLEIHFVHKSDVGEVLVVGVFVQAEENAELDLPLQNDLPVAAGERVVADGTKNPSDFLPRSRRYFTYTGSFTTPPCTEQVRWILMQQPVGVDPRLIQRISTILKANNRPLQKLNDRVVERSK